MKENFENSGDVSKVVVLSMDHGLTTRGKRIAPVMALDVMRLEALRAEFGEIRNGGSPSIVMINETFFDDPVRFVNDLSSPGGGLPASPLI